MPSLTKIGETAEGDVYVCPQCGDVTTVPKKEGAPPKRDSSLSSGADSP